MLFSLTREEKTPIYGTIFIMDKDKLRKNVKSAFLSFTKKKEEEILIIGKIKALDEYKRAETVLIYDALSDEVDLKDLLSDVTKTFLFPYIKGEEMFFGTRPLKKGMFSIMEPENKIEYPYEKALMLVPGRAFSIKNERLGRGKGFYDRYIRENRRRIHTIGICFSFQLFSSLPMAEHDQRVDIVISGGQ